MAIHVFCGAGGLSAGLGQPSFRVVTAVDILPLAVESYRMNEPLGAAPTPTRP